MKNMMKCTALLSTVLALGLHGTSLAADFQLDKLQVNHMTAPLGLDDKIPHFSWQMKLRGAVKPVAEKQAAYELQVKDSMGKVVWDTGRVAQGNSLDIAYAGATLQREMPYTWTVRVWDQDGDVQEQTSSFESGLNLERKGEGNWQGAQWIGAEGGTLPLDAHSLAVYKIQSTIQLEEGSNHAGIVFGANDSRLMEAGKNLWGLQAKKDGSWLKLVFDISDLQKNKMAQAKLKLYRQGYSQKDNGAAALAEFAVDRKAVDGRNMYAPHTIWLTSNHGILRLGVDDTTIALPKVNFWTDGYVVNPAGAGGDFISFPMVGDIGFAVDAGQQADFLDLTIRNYRSPGNAVFQENLQQGTRNSIFTGKVGVDVTSHGYHVIGGAQGTLAIADPSHGAMPMLRAVFQTQAKPVMRARLFASSRGIYDFYINGKRVNTSYFAPGLTQYDKTQLYQTYDVTEFIQKGRNAMGAQLAEGWWSGAITFQGENWNYFGDRQSLLAKLVITYKDGSQEILTTNPRQWQVFGDGPVRSGSLFQGENYDANKEQADWSTTAFVAGGWQPAADVPLDKTAAFFGSWKHCMTGTEKQQDYHDFTLVGQEGPAVEAVETLTAKSVHKAASDVYIYDMGQNMAGVPRIQLPDGQLGKKLTLRYAEVLYPHGKLGGGHDGQMMLENIRGALATDTYVMKAGRNVIAPRYTYHGYRYVEISGLAEPLPLTYVQGVVLSSLHEPAGSFTSSDAAVNRLYENIVWSARANFFSIPTDCPQRNERMGWSGDLSMFVRTAGYLADTDRFLARHLQAMRDLQDPNGRFGDIAPIGNGFGGVLWGSAGMTVPWELYCQYDDKSILEVHYAAMKRYADYLETCVGKDGKISEHTLLELGDWLGPENSKNDVCYLLTAYELYDLDITAKAALVLGKADESAYYRALYELRKAWFHTQFIDKVSHRTLKSDGSQMDTQTSYAVPLALGIFDAVERPYAERYLAEACQRQNTDDLKVKRPSYSLMTGFIGTSWISKALSDSGRSDIAYKMLENQQYPSWLYPVAQGATTIWERLNSYTKDNGFGGNNNMNSFNHYSFGAVGAWLYNYTLGIQRDESSPGWQHFILQPQPDFGGRMTWAKGYYDAPYGRIESAWRLADRHWIYDAVVPANMSAALILPVQTEDSCIEVSVNGNKQSFPVKAHKVEMNLVSGAWHIVISPK